MAKPTHPAVQSETQMNTHSAVIIDPDKWYKTGPAAKLLGVARATLVARINAGLIQARQMKPLGHGTPHRMVKGSEILRELGEVPMTPPPAPKKRSNAARRDGQRALEEMGLG